MLRFLVPKSRFGVPDPKQRQANMNPGIFTRSFATLAAAAVLGGGLVVQGPVAFAQSSPGGAPPSSSTASAASPSMAPHSDAAVEARIKRLHAQLKITPDQEDQWNAMAQIMRSNADKLSGLAQQRAKNAPSMSAVDNLRTFEEITAAQEDGLKQLLPSFGKLYDSMSDAQKKTADAVFNQRIQARVATQTKPATPAKPSGG
jgi:periplasmic protein CpxP/Spy